MRIFNSNEDFSRYRSNQAQIADTHSDFKVIFLSYTYLYISCKHTSSVHLFKTINLFLRILLLLRLYLSPSLNKLSTTVLYF